MAPAIATTAAPATAGAEVDSLQSFAGTGTTGSTGDGGPATSASLNHPGGVAVAGDGTRATEAGFGQLGGLAVASDRTVYFGDLDGHRVRAITPDGVLSTVAGNGGSQVIAAGGPATAIAVPSPTSLAIDAEDSVWIASGLLVHRLSAGKPATVVLPEKLAGDRWDLAEDADWPPAREPLNNINAIAAGADGVYALDQREQSVRRLGARHVVDEVASLASTGGLATGPIAVGTSGTAYFADGEGHRVYGFHPPAAPTTAPEPEDGGQTATWLWVAIGGGAILIGAGAWLILRRRRAD